MKFNDAAYKRNIRKALGRSLPLGGSTSIANNGDFVVYDSGVRIIGRVAKNEWEAF